MFSNISIMVSNYRVTGLVSLNPSYVQQSTCLGRLKTNYLSGFVYRAESLQEHSWAETPGQWSFWSSVHLCVVLLKVQPPWLLTHHFLLLSLPLLLDLFSQFVQLIFSGQERLERNTENPHHTHKSSKTTCFHHTTHDKVRFHECSSYLHEFVALEYCCSLKNQLAILDVIFESCHVDLTERHEFLERGRRGLNLSP